MDEFRQIARNAYLHLAFIKGDYDPPADEFRLVVAPRVVAEKETEAFFFKQLADDLAEQGPLGRGNWIRESRGKSAISRRDKATREKSEANVLRTALPAIPLQRIRYPGRACSRQEQLMNAFSIALQGDNDPLTWLSTIMTF